MAPDTTERRQVLQLVLFFLLTLLAWVVWLPQAAYRLGAVTWAPSLTSPLNAITVWSPAFAAIVVTGIFQGRRAIRRLLGRLGMWRIGWRWYLVALLFEPARWLLALGIDRMLGRSYDLGSTHLLETLGPTPGFMLVVAVVFTVPNAIGEEIGWRGFALGRLQAWRGALVASVVLGLFWGLWHIPGWIGQGVSTGLGSMTVRLCGIVAATIVFTWIYNGSGGSLVAVVLYHASIATKGYLLPSLQTSTEEIVLWIAVIVLIAATWSQWLQREVPHDGSGEPSVELHR